MFHFSNDSDNEGDIFVNVHKEADDTDIGRSNKQMKVTLKVLFHQI
jgi:hypothetical protein